MGKKVSISEFRKIIREEVVKLINESFTENFDEMEEGFFGPNKEEIESNKQELSAQIDALMTPLLAKIPDGWKIVGSKEEVLNKAADSKFKGEPWLKRGHGLNTNTVYLGFKPEISRFQQFASAAASSRRAE